MAEASAVKINGKNRSLSSPFRARIVLSPLISIFNESTSYIGVSDTFELDVSSVGPVIDG